MHEYNFENGRKSLSVKKFFYNELKKLYKVGTTAHKNN